MACVFINGHLCPRYWDTASKVALFSSEIRQYFLYDDRPLITLIRLLESEALEGDRILAIYEQDLKEDMFVFYGPVPEDWLDRVRNDEFLMANFHVTDSEGHVLLRRNWGGKHNEGAVGKDITMELLPSTPCYPVTISCAPGHESNEWYFKDKKTLRCDCALNITMDWERVTNGKSKPWTIVGVKDMANYELTKKDGSEITFEDIDALKAPAFEESEIDTRFSLSVKYKDYEAFAEHIDKLSEDEKQVLYAMFASLAQNNETNYAATLLVSGAIEEVPTVTNDTWKNKYTFEL